MSALPHLLCLALRLRETFLHTTTYLEALYTNQIAITNTILQIITNMSRYFLPQKRIIENNAAALTDCGLNCPLDKLHDT